MRSTLPLPLLALLLAAACESPPDSTPSPLATPTARLSPTPAPSEIIHVGGATLQLGMPRDDALERLSKEFDVREGSGRTDTFESWDVWTKGLTHVAGVTLKGGRLFTVIKNWGPEDGHRGVALARALYGAASEVAREGKRTCKLDRDNQTGPGWESKAVLIVCGDRHISIEISRSDDPRIGELATVTEALGGKAQASRLVSHLPEGGSRD